MSAKPIFVGGTSSHAGKSWMTTAICAWLRRRGVRVAPFKAQNMSNNSYPCKAGGEIGRAQVAQAWACGLDPEPAMNPILLKPEAASRSQVIVNGKMWKTLPARGYYEHFDFLLGQVLDAYHNLAERFDVVVIEGAGSVSELNLKQFDLVNLGLATRLNAPWLLVSDIERGGVFASVTGTVQLLDERERSLLRAFAINKFRGDLSLFDDGRRILEERAGVPCLGVFPFAHDIHLDDEDSLCIPESRQVPAQSESRCAIIRFPRISNTTDFRLLPAARWLDAPIDASFDFIFLPGTKGTMDDLAWLRRAGLDDWILRQHRAGATIIGICGGLQMLGRTIRDPLGMESHQSEMSGLGLLPVETTLSNEKTTRLVNAHLSSGHQFAAYEIHLGQTFVSQQPRPTPFAFLEPDSRPEGFVADRVYGTYLHGAFEDADVLAAIGITATPTAVADTYKALADWFDLHAPRFEEIFLNNA